MCISSIVRIAGIVRIAILRILRIVDKCKDHDDSSGMLNDYDGGHIVRTMMRTRIMSHSKLL